MVSTVEDFACESSFAGRFMWVSEKTAVTQLTTGKPVRQQLDALCGQSHRFDLHALLCSWLQSIPLTLVNQAQS